MAGYRVCGERAVRVDILERLADLIRPALAWREGALGAKPQGAVAGGGFTVVNAMTSLTGASGEDFASILRSLGYRMEQRPKPAEPTPPVTTPGLPAEVADLAASGEEAAVAAESAEAAPHPAGGDAETDAATPPDIVSDAPLAPVDAPEPEAETATAQESQQIAGPPSASSEEVGLASPSGPLAENGESDIIAAAATPPPPEPILIEVWRPGRPARPEGRRRPRDRHREAGKNRAKGTGEQMQDAGAPAVATEAAAAAPPAELTAAGPAEPGKPERQTRHHRRRGPDQRFERPRREGQRPPHVARHERQERREKAPDPNSPFAKLAALKAQLEEEAKERR
jgi:ATP-dependent RNA helicase SUPV3L1/SUV3